MIGLMDKGGANAVQQQNGLASAFANNAPSPVQSVPQISAPTMPVSATQSAPAHDKGGSNSVQPQPGLGPVLTPQQAAALTAARIQARIPPAPVAAAPTGPAPFTGDANLPKVKPQGIVGRNFASAR